MSPILFCLLVFSEKGMFNTDVSYYCSMFYFLMSLTL